MPRMLPPLDEQKPQKAAADAAASQTEGEPQAAADEAEAALAAKPRRLGRPKGSWNQARIEREIGKLVEAARREAEKASSERRVGRPKGRKNDRTLEKEEKAMTMMRAEQERLARGAAEREQAKM